MMSAQHNYCYSSITSKALIPGCSIQSYNPNSRPPSNICVLYSSVVGDHGVCATSRKNKKKEGFKVEAAVSLGEQEVEKLLDTVKWDGKGLAVAIAQNVDTGAILMQGFANREALTTTISTRKATFYSRSRSSLWIKGETSMNFINVHDVYLDCDRDSIIYLGKPDGPTCHTGMETCYYTSLNTLLPDSKVEQIKLAMTTLYSLESTISQRKLEVAKTENEKPSWTKRLLLDNSLLCSKIRITNSY